MAKRVFSSYIDTVEYDEEHETLTVIYSRGGSTVYSGVPADIGRAVEDAPSVGEAIHAQIAGIYSHRSVKGGGRA